MVVFRDIRENSAEYTNIKVKATKSLGSHYGAIGNS